jgi:nucleoside-diphosphate-sugar epimerase
VGETPKVGTSGERLNDSNARAVAIVGGRSRVGRHVVRLLEAAEWRVRAFSRSDIAAHGTASTPAPISHWVYVAHIWTLPEHFVFLRSFGARRLVVISSTSRFTKTTSSDQAERALAQRLSESEDRILTWATDNGVECTILRPTLIYGGGDDRNISEVAAFIRRFGVFPLLGPATGLRQPIHVEDVAAACVAVLQRQGLKPAYNISGGEILPYREMIKRIFDALGRRPRFVTVPRTAVKAGVSLTQLIPRFRALSRGMAERMMSDLVFDHADAARDFAFQARPFVLAPKDIALSSAMMTAELVQSQSRAAHGAAKGFMEGQ